MSRRSFLCTARLQFTGLPSKLTDERPREGASFPSQQADGAAVSSGLHTEDSPEVPHWCVFFGRVDTANVHGRGGPAGWVHETKGTSMGDRGGKKDKKKNQQQLATKQKHKEQQKLDKAPSKTPLAATS